MDKKKMWLSIGLVILVAGGAITATAAYFTAQRTASTNKFTAGTLDMSVQSDSVVNKPFVIENMGDNANIEGTQTWTIKNTGTLPGRLLVRLQNVVNKENDCNDQEIAAEPGCGTGDTATEGELGGVVTLNVGLDGVDKVSSTLITTNQSKVGNDWNALAPIILQAGESKTVTAHWKTLESAYGNEIQSDSLEFDLNFRLIQAVNGPTPTNN